jgi:ribose transport system ATP-binding protein
MSDAWPSAASNPVSTLLEMRDIGKSYGAAQVLKNAHFRLATGEIHGLVGENGAGKSTLVKILAGEVARDAGEIVWEGRALPIHSRRDAERLGVTMIHQELNLAPHLTVAQNVLLGHEPSRAGILSPRREVEQAREALARLGFDLDPGAPVRRLGPARRQLVEIARAVVRVVIMDEPTSSLSAREVTDLFRVVRQLREHGTAVVFVTHRLEELAEIADRVTVLRDGETVHEGPMPRRGFEELFRAMVGRELGDFFTRHPERPVSEEIALEVRGLGRGRDFADVNLKVRRGEIVGLAGLIGAGRTEVAEAIFGAAPAERGKVLIEGREVNIRNPQDAIRHGLALLTEDRRRTGLALSLSLAPNVTLADLEAITRHGRLDLAKEEQVARGFMNRLRIRAASPKQRTARLSGGNQQKVVIAKWLFRQARILIFDEPTRGVDVGAKAEIYRLMRELAEAGAAILMVSSELPEILGMTDRVLVMRDGRIVKELVTAKTTQEEIIRWATVG